MLKKIITTLSLALITQTAQAGIIDYTLDEKTKTVTGGGLQWLQWSETTNMSLDQVFTSYGAMGWRLASSADMVGLFNTFQFGRSDWDAALVNSESEMALTPWTASETSTHNHFHNLFGITDDRNCEIFPRSVCAYKDDPDVTSMAWYGYDGTDIKRAIVSDDTTLYWKWPSPFTSYNDAYAVLNQNFFAEDLAVSNAGYALVRDFTKTPTPIVSSPASGSLAILAMTTLVMLRRRNSTRS
jgi:hypothetical protein